MFLFLWVIHNYVVLYLNHNSIKRLLTTLRNMLTTRLMDSIAVVWNVFFISHPSFVATSWIRPMWKAKVVDTPTHTTSGTTWKITIFTNDPLHNARWNYIPMFNVYHLYSRYICTAVNCNNYVKCNTNAKCNNFFDVKCNNWRKM